MSQQIYITFIEKEPPFLKVWGQIDKSMPMNIEKSLRAMATSFDTGQWMVNTFEQGVICCAKFKDGSYYRCMVLNPNFIMGQGIVEVMYIDYGNRDFADIKTLRSLDCIPQLKAILPQAKCYYLAGFLLANTTDNLMFEFLSNELRYTSFDYKITVAGGRFQLITLIKDLIDHTPSLVIRGFGNSIDLHKQCAILQNPQLLPMPPMQQMVLPIQHIYPTIVPSMPSHHPSPSTPQQMSPPTPTLISYKTNPLEVGSEYEVYVSYVNDGPCLFSVQLKNNEDRLKELMMDLNTLSLINLEEPPLPGTACLARSLGDDYICRAVVTNMVGGYFKVFYVDFGNSEELEFKKLYQIPYKYVIPKVMSTRFILFGLNNSILSHEMKCAFKTFVNDKALIMKVMPANQGSALAQCELRDHSNINALEHVKNFALNSYPQSLVINRGTVHDVIVSFVYSCSRFYARLKSKCEDLDTLMGDLGSFCSKGKAIDLSSIKVGIPCNALYLNDGMFYRAEIIQTDNGQAKVFYVDYGNEEFVNNCNLRATTPKFVTMLRPQAIQCCLAGYQNMSDDKERDGILEELILEAEFSMKVVEVMEDKILVDLIDGAGINVASSLLEKMAAKKGLYVSPRSDDGRKGNYQDSKSPRGLNRKGDSPRDARNDGLSWRNKEPSREPHFTDVNNSSQRNNEWKDKIADSNMDGKPEFKRSDSKGFRDNDRGSSRDFNKRNDNKKDLECTIDTRKWDKKPNDNEWNDNKKESTWSSNKERGDRNKTSWEEKKPTDNDWNNKRSESSTWDNKKSYNRDDSSGYKRADRDDSSGYKRADRDDSSGFKKGGRDDSWGNKGGRDDSWGNKGSDKDNSWGNKKAEGSSSWNNKRDDAGEKWEGDNQAREEGTKNTYQKRNDSSSYNKKGRDENNYTKNTKDNWNSNKRSDFKKPSRNHNFNNNKNRRGDGDWAGTNKSSNNFKSQNTWEESTENYDYAENDALYLSSEIVGKTEKIEVTYFYNPSNFYCQLQINQKEFCALMKEIQKEYRKAQIFSDAPINCPVIAQFPEDKLLYRAIILNNESGTYNIRYIDFGNTHKTRNVYKIQKKHLSLPVLAYNCTLNNIVPNGENWVELAKFSKYFQRDQLDCNFISVEENFYNVDLSFNGKQVKDELIEDALALDQPIFDMNILWGQQLRCQIAAANNPGDLLVEIQPELFLPAHIHDFDKASKIFEEKLQPLLGQFIIVYVNYILNEKLDLDLYDLSGNKIQVIEPDEGLPTVNPICPLTVFSNNLDGYVSHASETSIFVQPTYNAEIITSLLEDMFNACDSLEIIEITPAIGKIYAVFSPDGNWYRGQVVSVTDEMVNVYYIDYGNCEDINVDLLRELPEIFYELPMLCIEILIENSKTYLESEISLNITFGDDGWLGTVESNTQEVELKELAENKELPAEIVTTEVITKTTEITNKEEDNLVIEEENVSIEEENVLIEEETQSLGFSVFLSHFDSPGQFYLQTTESIDPIALLQERLQAEAEDLPNIESVSIGALCAAKYSGDEQWYRARVLDFDSDITTIRFIDYGNTDVLDNSPSVIKTLPQDLLVIEEYAKRCSLYVSPNNNEWSAEACDKFTDITTDKTLMAEILHQDEKTTYVELFDGSNTISSVMINEGYASQLIIESKSFTGFISNLNSPSEFWIQLESSCNDLEWVAEQLINGGNFTVLKDMEPGTLCAAVFPEDESWYRARILSNTVAGLEVLFIDYGNSCTSLSLRELPEELAVVAPLASKCSLQKPNGILEWASAATQKFKEMAADGATIFTINKISHGETSVVQLLLDDTDIALNLVPELFEGYITYAKSVNEFYIVKTWEELQEYNKYLDENAESWVDAESFDGVVIGLDEDKKWRRCTKLEDNVFFIDSGKTGNSDRFKKLPNDDSEVEPFAIVGKLEPPSGFKWSNESDKNFIEIIKTVDFKVQVEDVADSTVRLYINFEDVRSNLNLIKYTPNNSTYSSPKKCISELATEESIKNPVCSSKLAPEEAVNNLNTSAELAAKEAIQNLLTSVANTSLKTGENCVMEVLTEIINFIGDNFTQKVEIDYKEECDKDIPNTVNGTITAPVEPDVIGKVQEEHCVSTNEYIKNFLTESIEIALNKEGSQ